MAPRETISYDSVERICAAIFCLDGTLFKPNRQNNNGKNAVINLDVVVSRTHTIALSECVAREHTVRERARDLIK